MHNDKYQDDANNLDHAAQEMLDRVGEGIQNGINMLNEMLYRHFESASDSEGTEFEARMPVIGSQNIATDDGLFDVIQMFWLVPHPEECGVHQFRFDLPVGSCEKRKLKDVLPGLQDDEFEYVWHIEEKARLLRESLESLHEILGPLCSPGGPPSEGRLQ